MTRDEEALHAHLDLEPGDLLVRSILADLYEAEGRDDEAAYQRWAVENEKWPTYLCHFSHNDHYPWDWWNPSPQTTGIYPKNACVGDLFRFLITPHNRKGAYLTRREAEADLMRVLIQQKLLTQEVAR